MKALKNRLNFVSLSLIIGTVISVSGLVPLIPQEMYITRLALSVSYTHLTLPTKA